MVKLHRALTAALTTALAVTAAAATVATVAAPASAATVDPNASYVLVSRHSGKALEIANGQDGAALTQQASSSVTRQHFRLADSDSGYVRLINRHSNKALDVWEWSTADGGRISQFSDLNGWNQQWQLVAVGGG